VPSASPWNSIIGKSDLPGEQVDCTMVLVRTDNGLQVPVVLVYSAPEFAANVLKRLERVGSHARVPTNPPPLEKPAARIRL
jgi:hypothetical protein